MVFETVGQILGSTPRRSPITPALLALKVEKETQKYLPPYAKMLFLREGRIVLSSPTPTHSQEIFLHSSVLKKKINESLGRKVIEEVRYRVNLES